jgi:hypothetical protein
MELVSATSAGGKRDCEAEFVEENGTEGRNSRTTARKSELLKNDTWPGAELLLIGRCHPAKS